MSTSIRGSLAQSQTGVLLQLVHLRLTLGGALSVSSRFVVGYGYMLNPGVVAIVFPARLEGAGSDWESKGLGIHRLRVNYWDLFLGHRA